METINVDALIEQSWTTDDPPFVDVYSVSPPDSPASSPAPSRASSPCTSTLPDTCLSSPCAMYSPSDYVSKRKRSRQGNGPSRKSKAQNVGRGRVNRKARRAEDAKVKLFIKQQSLKNVPTKRFRFADAEVLETVVDAEDLPAAGTGYVGYSDELPPPKAVWLSEIVGGKTKYNLKVVKALEPG